MVDFGAGSVSLHDGFGAAEIVATKVCTDDVRAGLQELIGAVELIFGFDDVNPLAAVVLSHGVGMEITEVAVVVILMFFDQEESLESGIVVLLAVEVGATEFTFEPSVLEFEGLEMSFRNSCWLEEHGETGLGSFDFTSTEQVLSSLVVEVLVLFVEALSSVRLFSSLL